MFKASFLENEYINGCISGNLSRISDAVAKGISVDFQHVITGQTGLHMVLSGHIMDIPAIDSHELCFKWLLDNKASVKIEDALGFTILDELVLRINEESGSKTLYNIYKDIVVT